MAIGLTSEASLDFAILQDRIKDQESSVHVRLTGLIGMTHMGVAFNAHTYVLVDVKTRPLSKLFIIPAGGTAANDPKVKTWLAQNPSQRIVCEGGVFISDSSANVAVVGNPP
jgi:hypothetical protein